MFRSSTEDDLIDFDGISELLELGETGLPRLIQEDLDAVTASYEASSDKHAAFSTLFPSHAHDPSPPRHPRELSQPRKPPSAESYHPNHQPLAANAHSSASHLSGTDLAKSSSDVSSYASFVPVASHDRAAAAVNTTMSTEGGSGFNYPYHSSSSSTSSIGGTSSSVSSSSHSNLLSQKYLPLPQPSLYLPHSSGVPPMGGYDVTGGGAGGLYHEYGMYYNAHPANDAIHGNNNNNNNNNNGNNNGNGSGSSNGLRNDLGNNNNRNEPISNYSNLHSSANVHLPASSSCSSVIRPAPQYSNGSDSDSVTLSSNNSHLGKANGQPSDVREGTSACTANGSKYSSAHIVNVVNNTINESLAAAAAMHGGGGGMLGGYSATTSTNDNNSNNNGNDNNNRNTIPTREAAKDSVSNNNYYSNPNGGFGNLIGPGALGVGKEMERGLDATGAVKVERGGSFNASTFSRVSAAAAARGLIPASSPSSFSSSATNSAINSATNSATNLAANAVAAAGAAPPPAAKTNNYPLTRSTNTNTNATTTSMDDSDLLGSNEESFLISSSGGMTKDGKKRRTRNSEQMELNRVAQQKYRERKRTEQDALQHAVDLLTTQVAALKAVEVLNQELTIENSRLKAVAMQQNAASANLQQQIAVQSAELAMVKSQLAEAQDLVAGQQRMMFDQHRKIHLQEQVIIALKEQLGVKIDEAMSASTPGSVCERLISTVKAALYDVKDADGLKTALESLPQGVVVKLCKNIFCTFQDLFPELKAKVCAMYSQGDQSNSTTYSHCC